MDRIPFVDEAVEGLLVRARDAAAWSEDGAPDRFVAEDVARVQRASGDLEMARSHRRGSRYGFKWTFWCVLALLVGLSGLAAFVNTFIDDRDVRGVYWLLLLVPAVPFIVDWRGKRKRLLVSRDAVRSATTALKEAERVLEAKRASWPEFERSARTTLASTLTEIEERRARQDEWVGRQEADVPTSQTDWPDVPDHVWSTLGTFDVVVAGRSFELPCPTVDWTDTDGLVAWRLDAAQVDAVQKRIVLDLLQQVPPTALRFHVYDPRTLGSGVAAFSRLTTTLPQLLGERVWTNPREIPELISRLGAEIGRRQRMLGENSVETGWELNRRVGRMDLTLDIVIMSTLSGLSRDTVQLLRPILEMGPRVMVVPVIFITNPEEIGYFERGNEQMRALIDEVLPETWLNGTIDRGIQEYSPILPDQFLASTNPTGGSWEPGAGPWRPRGPSMDALETALAALATAVEDFRAAVKLRSAVPLGDVVDRSEGWSSRDGLRIPVGKSGDASLEVTLGDDPVHGLVIGTVGSGKSNFLHSFIHSAISRYGPEDLDLVLVDMKEGVEFTSVYAADDHNATFPQISVVAADADPEFGAGVLAATVEEIGRRGELFRENGVRSFAGLRDAGVPLPRRVVVIDEFQRVFRDDRLQEQAWNLLAAVAREGRAFGVHLLLATQTLIGVPGGGLPLARGALDQFGLRIALACSEEDSLFMLDDDSAASLSGPGEGIVSSRRGTDDNKRVRIARFDEHEFAGSRAPHPAVVFHGRPRGFVDLPDHLRTSGQVTRLPLGVASDLGEQPTLELWSESFRHLGVLAGGATNFDGTLRLIESAAVAAVDRGWEILIWDLISPANPIREQLDALWGYLQGRSERVRVIPGTSALPEPGDGRSIVVAVGLERWSQVGGEPSALSGVLAADGLRGRHWIATGSSYKAFEEAVGRNPERAFGARIALPGTGDDGARFLNERFNGTKSNRAWFTDAERPGELRSLIPYRSSVPRQPA